MEEEKSKIRERLRAMRKEELAERRILLEEHDKKYWKLRDEIEEACEATGGHRWTALPNNGLNGPHFITGEWPHACGHCSKSKPREG